MLIFKENTFFKNCFRQLSLIMTLCLFWGCARLVETAKVFWGSSTRALEEARSEAITKKFRCTVTECFDAVIELTKVQMATPLEQSALTKMVDEGKTKEAEKEKDREHIAATAPKTDTWDTAVKAKKLDLFISDRKRQLIVLMGIPGNENTTEVGVFFTPVSEQEVKVEVSALSLTAKNTASDMIFAELKMHYEEAK